MSANIISSLPLGPLDPERSELLLRVDNLFDTVYAASGFSAQSGHFPGEPRTFLTELRLRF